MKSITVKSLQRLKQAGKKFACLTCYDYAFAKLLNQAEVEVLLVGDSLGNVIQGHTTTIPVTVADIAYHTSCVVRGSQSALIMADMPFLSYADEASTITNARTLMQAGAHLVKLEGRANLIPLIKKLTDCGVPSCAHLGLRAQAVNLTGGYKVYGRDAAEAAELKATAEALEAAGASLILLECVPQQLAAEITNELSIPVIGIGAGPNTDGQILVLYDILGITDCSRFTFCHNFAGEVTSPLAAIKKYAAAVKQQTFPTLEHSFD